MWNKMTAAEALLSLTEWQKGFNSELIRRMYTEAFNFDSGPLVEAQCECGSDKAGMPGHSTWCPKHT